jgi:8-oxo-dGTP diphosphatase
MLRATQAPRHTNDDPSAPLVVVGAVVLRDDGRVLLVRRANAPLAGEWTLVGGHVDADEALADAVVREVREEAGLDVVVDHLLEVIVLAREGFRYEIHEHLCRLVDDARADDARAASDATGVRWAHESELEALGVRADAAGVIRRALALGPAGGTP